MYRPTAGQFRPAVGQIKYGASQALFTPLVAEDDAGGISNAAKAALVVGAAALTVAVVFGVSKVGGAL